MGDDGFFSVFQDIDNYLYGKKKGGFSKYDKVVDHVLEDFDNVPDKTPQPPTKKGKPQVSKGTRAPKKKQIERRNFGPMATKKKGGYTRSRTYTKRKPAKRKRIAKKTKMSYKKRKTGSKRIALTPGTARLRLVDHLTKTENHAHYQSFSATGKTDNYLLIIAEAMLLHYMHRVGDYRAGREMQPVGNDLATSATLDQLTTWTHMEISFLGVNAASDGNNNSKRTITNTPVAGVTPSLATLAATLAGYLEEQFEIGRRVSQVAVFRDQNQCILFDISAGRNVIEFSSHATMKLQNTSPADATEGDPNSMTNIHRNPVNGFAYKFKNQVPLLKMQYLVSKSNAVRSALDALSARNNEFTGITHVNLAAYGDEWKSPPVAPTTLFRNYSGKTATHISPGRHTTYTLSEHFKGPINSFADRYIRQDKDGSFSDSTAPPGSSCIMVGLKPQYRTGGTEDIKLEREVKYTYCARMTKAKLTAMPMQTKLS